MPKKTYIFMLSDKDRKRHEHLSDKGKVIEFVVQYETLFESELPRPEGRGIWIRIISVVYVQFDADSLYIVL